MSKANFYIDGFNLYNGICETGDKTVLWLDLVQLAQSLLDPLDQLNRIRYFTALPLISADKIRRGQGFIPTHIRKSIKDGQKKLKRHITYLHALAYLDTEIFIHLGNYVWKPISYWGYCDNCQQMISKRSIGELSCLNCRNLIDKNFWVSEEKQTDVALASYIVRDVLLGDCNNIYIISADTDFIPALRIVLKESPSTRVSIIFPPKRRNEMVRKSATSVRQLSITQLVNFRMAQNINIGNRNRLTMPVSWLAQSSNPINLQQATDQNGSAGKLYIEGVGAKKVLHPLHPTFELT